MHASGPSVPLRPVPDFAGACPRCAEPLRVARLHLPGWRVLVEGTCPRCDGRFVQDLPAGHALVYPATLDLGTGEVFDPTETTWFSQWLARAWTAPSDDDVRLSIDGPGATRPATLLNCLDPIYGHALLKLLNAQRHLLDGDRDLVVLVPRALAHLVPDGVAERWTLDAPPSVAWQWLLALDRRLAGELDRLGDCVLSPAFPHPHPSTWDLDAFVGDVAPQRRGSPSLVLAFRDDRPWGLTAGHQRANVAMLWGLLRRRWPQAGAALVGVGRAGGAPTGIEDLRAERPSVDDEQAWLAAARGADMVIGVHGSHLLLPSGLARLTLELTPTERHGNALQATLVRETDPLLALWRYRQILGGRHLADVSPQRVAGVAAQMVDGAERFAALMTGPPAGVGQAPSASLPPVGPGHGTGALPRPPIGRVVARGRRAAGFARLAMARRRISGRAPSAPALLTDRRGLRFELLDRAEIEAFLLHEGHFEGDELDFLAGRPLSGTCIDVGANIGAFTAVLARAVGPAGHVHAFEPMAGPRERLHRTLAVNDLHNVSVHEAAVSDSAGTAEAAFYGPGYESWTSLTRQSVELPDGPLRPVQQITVPTVTLDAFARDNGIERVAVLKIDVEGAEGRVLSGAATLLAEQRVELLLLELSDHTLGDDGWTAGAVVRLLEEHGYGAWVLDGGVLRPFRVAGVVDFANVVALPLSAEGVA